MKFKLQKERESFPLAFGFALNLTASRSALFLYHNICVLVKFTLLPSLRTRSLYEFIYIQIHCGAFSVIGSFIIFKWTFLAFMGSTSFSVVDSATHLHPWIWIIFIFVSYFINYKNRTLFFYIQLWPVVVRPDCVFMLHGRVSVVSALHPHTSNGPHLPVAFYSFTALSQYHPSLIKFSS